MRLSLVALFVIGCNGCQATPQPTPPGPSGPPPQPVFADAGSPCATECARAIAECAKPLLSQDTCVFRCTEAMTHRTGAVPACEASVSVCNGTKGCP